MINSEDIPFFQKNICQKFNSDFIDCPDFLKVGMSRNVMDGAMPINGLRHFPENNTTGWFIWGGESFSDSPDFFVPIHVIHLKDICPIIVKYLALEPGFRFLVTGEYEDVWRDTSLLVNHSNISM